MQQPKWRKIIHHQALHQKKILRKILPKKTNKRARILRENLHQIPEVEVRRAKSDSMAPHPATSPVRRMLPIKFLMIYQRAARLPLRILKTLSQSPKQSRRRASLKRRPPKWLKWLKRANSCLLTKFLKPLSCKRWLREKRMWPLLVKRNTKLTPQVILEVEVLTDLFQCGILIIWSSQIDMMKPDGSTMSMFWVASPRKEECAYSIILSLRLSPCTREKLFSQAFGLQSKLIWLLVDRKKWIRVSKITRSLTSKDCVINSDNLIQDLNTIKTKTESRLQFTTCGPLKCILSGKESLLTNTLRSWIHIWPCLMTQKSIKAILNKVIGMVTELNLAPAFKKFI